MGRESISGDEPEKISPRTVKPVIVPMEVGKLQNQPREPYRDSAVIPPLRLIFWELTSGCNLRCVHCRATAQPERAPNELTTPEAFRIVDELAGLGRPIVILTGGEPLYRPDVLDIASRASRAGLHVALATNGTLVDDSLAKNIREAGVERVSISIDGGRRQTHDSFRGIPGAFDKALAGFRRLKKLGISMQLNTTVSKHNVDELEDIFALAREEGADALHLFMLVPVGCGLEIADAQMLPAERYEEVLNWLYEKARDYAGKLEFKATCAPHYYRIVRQRAKQDGRLPATSGHGMSAMTKGCLAGSGVMFLSHEGKVQPCGYLPVEAGNVRRQPLGEIWAKSPVFAKLRDPELLTGKCGRCEYKKVCAGCRARAFAATGDYLAEEPYCVYEPLSAGHEPT